MKTRTYNEKQQTTIDLVIKHCKTVDNFVSQMKVSKNVVTQRSAKSHFIKNPRLSKAETEYFKLKETYNEMLEQNLSLKAENTILLNKNNK